MRVSTGKKQIIAVSALLADIPGGVNAYIRNLCSGLSSWTDRFDFILFTNPRSDEPIPDWPNTVPFPLWRSNPISRIIQERLTWPRLIKRHHIDLFHSPVSYIPPGVKVPAVFTVHDLRAFHFPQTYQKLRVLFLQRQIPHSISQAQRIIAVSDYTRNDLIRLFSVPAKKIVTIHEGIDSKKYQTPTMNRDAILHKFQLPGRYLLAVGHLEPRKNYVRLFRALALLRDRFRIDLPLVVCGRKNWQVDEIQKEIDRLHLANQVRLFGAVDEADLIGLYQSAFIFIFPSLFEGFGFPPLESMAAGVPVVASNTTSIPEVCGDAALYFDPHDEEEMAERIYQLIDDPQLYKLQVVKGNENIKRFSWERCVRETVNLYHNALETAEIGA